MDILEKIGLILEEKFNLKAEIWKEPVKNKEGELVIGTIRTTPANYWVATILDGNKLKWNSFEGMTKNIDKKYVENWFKDYLKSKDSGG